MGELINSNPDFKGAFGDKRIEKRATQALSKLTMGVTAVSKEGILGFMLHSSLVVDAHSKHALGYSCIIGNRLEGITEKLKNRAKINTLKWATWIIARLGGWKGYTSQRKPGPIVLQKGLAKFYNVYEGWTLYQNYQEDVYTQ